MICQRCEAEVPESSNFCTQCGASLANLLAGSPCTPLAAHYRLDLAKLLNDTFELYKRNFGTMCLVGLVLMVVPLAFFPLSFASSFMQEMAEQAGNPALYWTLVGGDVFLAILQGVLQWYFMLGAFRQSLYLARGGAGFQGNQMCPPFMMFLKFIGYMFLLFSIMLSIMLPAVFMIAIAIFAVQGNNDLAAMPFLPVMVAGIMFCLVCYCVLIWIGTRLFLAQMFIADRDAGVIDSMKDAWRVSSGNFWMLFLANLVLAIFSMLGYFLCCVGIVLTVAVIYLGSVLAYMQLTGQPNCLDAPPLQNLEMQL